MPLVDIVIYIAHLRESRFNMRVKQDFHSPLLTRKRKEPYFKHVRWSLFVCVVVAAIFLLERHDVFTSEENAIGVTPGQPPQQGKAPQSSTDAKATSPKASASPPKSPKSPTSPKTASSASASAGTAQEDKRVVVIGSINVDLYLKLGPDSSLTMESHKLDISAVKGMTLPSEAFLEMPAILDQLQRAKLTPSEELVFSIQGDLDQKTGGKGANAAAAAGQTFKCEFIGQMGADSSKENQMLFQDLANFGAVQVQRVVVKPETRTGTAYIFLYPDNDNSILLIGGANQDWPAVGELEKNGLFTSGLKGAVALMLQREIPNYINLYAAKTASAMKIPVMMDVGGTNAALDEQLIPYVTLIVPNESELTFISGVQTQVGGNIDKNMIRQAVSKLKEIFASKGNSNVEVLVTLGACGSIFFESDWSMAMQPPDSVTGLLQYETYVGCFPLSTPNKKPVDTTGAGDCYRGSFVAARFGEQKSILQSMQWAASASSLAVEGKGAMPSMPSRAAIEERISNGKKQFGEELNLGLWK